jgi:mRNA interferase RelE/StbE
VNVKFEYRFEKDLQSVKDKKLFSKIKKIIINCKNSDNLSQIKNIKKLKGYDTFFRIKIADYRIGVEIQKNELIFVRFLHRKDIYRFFPSN